MEYLLSPVHDQAYRDRIESMTRKSSVEFFEAFDVFIHKVERQDSNFEDLYYKEHLLLSKDEILSSYLTAPMSSNVRPGCCRSEAV